MQYPLQLRFKIIAIAPQIYIDDASGNTAMYVKQKAFKLKEDITVYADDQQNVERFKIKADRIIDFNASYGFSDANGRELGAVKRQGVRSLWKASYGISDAHGNVSLTMREENPWVKVLDSLVEDVPVIGMLSGYFLNPSYLVTREDGTPVMRLTKRPSLLERRFEIEKLADLGGDEEARALLSTIMLVLLEKDRG